MTDTSGQQPALRKYHVTVDSPVSGLVGHVIRAGDAEAAGLRALRSYPAGCALAGVRLIGAEAAQ